MTLRLVVTLQDGTERTLPLDESEVEAVGGEAAARAAMQQVGMKLDVGAKWRVVRLRPAGSRKMFRRVKKGRRR